jgi:hypothetical protein
MGDLNLNLYTHLTPTLLGKFDYSPRMTSRKAGDDNFSQYNIHQRHTNKFVETLMEA